MTRTYSLKTTASVGVINRLIAIDGTTGRFFKEATTIPNGTQLTGSVLLTSVTGVVDIDASLGPNFHMTLTSSVTFNNPLNATAGQDLVVVVAQDAIGGFQTVFDQIGSNWSPTGQLAEIAASASSETILSAVARDFGSGLNWDYAISHGQSADGITDIAATLTTTGSGIETIAIVPVSLLNTFGVGLEDISVVAYASASRETVQFGIRSLMERSGSDLILVGAGEDVYSTTGTAAVLGTWVVTHSLAVSTISIKVQTTEAKTVVWKVKGIFQEVP